MCDNSELFFSTHFFNYSPGPLLIYITDRKSFRLILWL
jgi:hypothetical protein